MAATPRSEDASRPLALEQIYTEVRTAIRETDRISFKLLGLVPLVSGTAMIGLVVQTRDLPLNLVILVALFASSVTLGLFRWELRNVQTCSWLIKYADAVEAHVLNARGMGEIFRTRPKAPQRIGKAEAEKLIYTTTVIAWLALPFGMAKVPQAPYRLGYCVAAGVILFGTIVSLFAKPRVPPIPVLPSNQPLQSTSGAGMQVES